MLNFKLVPDWQIKKEPLHLVFKTCQCCTRRVEMWSDRADDTDAFWCGQCSVVSNDTSVEPFRMVTTDTTTTFVTANNSPHLSVRWTQPLCVSSCIQQSKSTNSLYQLVKTGLCVLINIDSIDDSPLFTVFYICPFFLVFF